MGNVHVCNIGISGIHGKELLRQLAIHQEYKRPHNETNVRHISKLVSEQDEISVLETNDWENHSWKYLSLSGDERVSIFNARRSLSFWILCCALERFSKTPNRTMHGNKDWDG